MLRLPSSRELWQLSDEQLDEYFHSHGIRRPEQILAAFAASQGVQAYAGAGANAAHLLIAYGNEQPLEGQEPVPYNIASAKVEMAGLSREGNQVIGVSGNLYNTYSNDLITAPPVYSGKYAGYRYAAETIASVRRHTSSPHQFYDELMRVSAPNAQAYLAGERQGNTILREQTLNVRQVRQSALPTAQWKAALETDAQHLGMILNPDYVTLEDERQRVYNIANVVGLPPDMPSEEWKRSKAQFRQRYAPADVYPGMGQYGETTYARIGVAGPGETESSGGGMVAAAEMYALSRSWIQPTRLEVPSELTGFRLSNRTTFGPGQNIIVGEWDAALNRKPATEPIGGAESGRILQQRISIGAGQDVVQALIDILGQDYRSVIGLAVGRPVYEANPLITKTEAVQAIQASVVSEQTQAQQQLSQLLGQRMGIAPETFTFHPGTGIEIRTEVEKRINASFKTPFIKGATFRIDPNLHTTVNGETIPLTALANAGVLKTNKLTGQLRESDIHWYLNTPLEHMHSAERDIALAMRTELEKQLGAKWQTDYRVGDNYTHAVTAYQAQKAALMNLGMFHYTAPTRNFFALEYGSASTRFNPLSLSYLRNQGGQNMRQLVDKIIQQGADPRIGSVMAALTNRGHLPLAGPIPVTPATTMESIAQVLEQQNIGRSKAFVVGQQWGLKYTVQSLESVPLQGQIHATWRNVVGAGSRAELEAAYAEYRQVAGEEYLSIGSQKQAGETTGTIIGGKARYANVNDPRFLGMTPEETRQRQLTMYIGAKQIAEIAASKGISFPEAYERIQNQQLFAVESRSPEFMGVALRQLAVNPTGLGDIQRALAIIQARGFNGFMERVAPRGEFWNAANPIVNGWEGDIQMGDDDGDSQQALVVSFKQAEARLARAALNEQQLPLRIAYERLTAIAGTDRAIMTRRAIAQQLGIDPRRVTMEQMLLGAGSVPGLQAIIPGTTKSQNVTYESTLDEMSPAKFMARVIDEGIVSASVNNSALSASQQRFERGRSNADIYGLAHMMGLRFSRLEQGEFNQAVRQFDQSFDELGLDPYRTAALGAVQAYQVPADFFTLPENLYRAYKQLEASTGLVMDNPATANPRALAERLAMGLAEPTTWEVNGETRSGHMMPAMTIAQMLLPKTASPLQGDENRKYQYSELQRITQEIERGSLSGTTITGMQTADLTDIVRAFQAENFLKKQQQGRYASVTDAEGQAQITARLAEVTALGTQNPHLLEDIMTVRRKGLPANITYGISGTVEGDNLMRIMEASFAAGGGSTAIPATLPALPEQEPVEFGGATGSNAAYVQAISQSYLGGSTIGQFFGPYAFQAARFQAFNRLGASHVSLALEESEGALELVGEQLKFGNAMEETLSNATNAPIAQARFGYRFKSTGEIKQWNATHPDKRLPSFTPQFAGIKTSVLPDYLKVMRQADGTVKLVMTDLKATQGMSMTPEKLRQYTLQQNIYAHGLVQLAKQPALAKRVLMEIGGFSETDAEDTVKALASATTLDDAFVGLDLFTTFTQADPFGAGSMGIHLNMYKTSEELVGEMQEAQVIFHATLQTPELWNQVAGMARAAREAVLERSRILDEQAKSGKPDTDWAVKPTDFIVFDWGTTKYHVNPALGMPGDAVESLTDLENHAVAQMQYLVANAPGPANRTGEAAVDSTHSEVIEGTLAPGARPWSAYWGSGRGGGGGIHAAAPGWEPSGTRWGDPRYADVLSQIVLDTLTEEGRLAKSAPPMSADIFRDPGMTEDALNMFSRIQMAAGGKMNTSDKARYITVLGNFAKGAGLNADAQKRAMNLYDMMLQGILDPQNDPLRESKGAMFDELFRAMLSPEGRVNTQLPEELVQQGVGDVAPMVRALNTVPTMAWGQMGGTADLRATVRALKTIQGSYSAGLSDETVGHMNALIDQGNALITAPPAQRKEMLARMRDEAFGRARESLKPREDLFQDDDYEVMRNFRETMKRTTENLNRYGTAIEETVKTHKEATKVIQAVVTNVRDLRRSASEMESLSNSGITTEEQAGELKRLAREQRGLAAGWEASLTPGGSIGEAISAEHGEDFLRKQVGLAAGEARSPLARASNRLLSGMFAFQMMRDIRYTISPLFQQGISSVQAEQATLAGLAEGGYGVPLMQSGSASAQFIGQFVPNLQAGLGTTYRNMLGGIAALAGGNNGYAIGAGPLGALAGIASPALGAAGAIGTMGWMGLIPEAAIAPAMLGGAAITAGVAGTLSFLGAANDQAAVARARMTTRRTGSGFDALNQNFWASAASVWETLNPLNFTPDMLQRQAQADLIYGGIQPILTQPGATGVPIANLNAEQRRALLVSSMDTGTRFRTTADQLGLTVEAGQQMVSLGMLRSGGGVMRYDVIDAAMQAASMGIDPNQALTLADRVAQLQGNVSALGGNDIFTRYATNPMGMQQLAMNLQAFGGAQTAWQRTRGGFGTFAENMADINAMATAGGYSWEQMQAYQEQYNRFQTMGGWNLAVAMERAGLGNAGTTGNQMMQNAGVYTDQDIARFQTNTQWQISQQNLIQQARQYRDYFPQQASAPTNAAQAVLQQSLQVRSSLVNNLVGSGYYSNQQALVMANQVAPWLSGEDLYSPQQLALQSGAMALANLNPMQRFMAERFMPNMLTPQAMSTQYGQAAMSFFGNPTPQSMTVAMAAGVVPANQFQPMFDLSTGADLFQRSMWGLTGMGMPNAGVVGGWLSQQQARLAGGTGANPWLRAGAGFQDQIVQAATGQGFGIGGIEGLQLLASQVQYESAINQVGIQSQQAALQHQYATTISQPQQYWKQMMGRVSQVGGTVATPWGVYDAGAGSFAWTQRGMDIDWASLQAGWTQNQTQYGWQVTDINRAQARAGVQVGWQRADLALNRQQTLLSRAMQDVQSGWNAQDMSLQRQYNAEDFAYGRQVSQLQFGWQMEDYDINIRRSTGFQRRQLMRNRDRDVEMFNLQTGHEDDLRKREEEAQKREEERYKKQQEYIKQTRQLEDEDFKRTRERLDEQKKWPDEDFTTQRSRATTQQGWQKEAYDRQVEQFKIRQEQFTAEKSAADVNYQMALTAYAADMDFENKRYALTQASLANAVAEQDKIEAINRSITALRSEENTRVLQLHNLEIDFWNRLIQAMNELTGSNYGLLSHLDPGVNTTGGGGGKDAVKQYALGGKLWPGHAESPQQGDALVGELGPELLRQTGRGVEVIPFARTREQPGSSFGTSTLTIAQPVQITLGNQVLADMILRILVQPTDRQTRRAYLRR